MPLNVRIVRFISPFPFPSVANRSRRNDTICQNVKKEVEHGHQQRRRQRKLSGLGFVSPYTTAALEDAQ